MHRRFILNSLLSGLILPLVPVKLASAAAKTGRRIVLIELSGANDGLNTVIPFANDRYFNLRPNLAIETKDRFSISNSLALHSALSDLGEIWERGQLAIIQGLGYPGANRSHFKSIALWETGGDGSGSGKTGWLTEDIEGLGTTHDFDAHGISLDGGMGVFTSKNGVWLSMTSAEQFKRLSKTTLTAKSTSQNPALEMLLTRAAALNSSMESITNKLSSSRSRHFKIRAGDLGRQLSLASTLIAAGIDTPVLKVKIDGFDTHENQSWRHQRLLENLGRALSGFAQQMQKIGQWDNTLVLTYSEFGRRAVENSTNGTDHGTAAPHFLSGGAINGGIYGKHPSLSALIDGDMQFTMDYRSVYEWILSQWFEIENNRFSQYRTAKLNSLMT
ncbi:DUF1501 domain-containing protein [Rhodobacteraceae bacterium Araon29]